MGLSQRFCSSPCGSQTLPWVMGMRTASLTQGQQNSLHQCRILGVGKFPALAWRQVSVQGRSAVSTLFPVTTSLCLVLPCRTVFCLSPRGRWPRLCMREGSRKSVYLLPAPNSTRSYVSLHHEVGSLRASALLFISCEPLMEACGKDLENRYLEPLYGRFPGILNSHVNTHSAL